MRPLIFSVVLLSCASGPKITESRTAQAPAKREDCDAPLLFLTPKEIASGYDVVGNVQITGEGHPDPASAEYKKMVRPHACHLGGDAITIARQSFTKARSETTVEYAVVKKRAKKP
jgi:hypothetical protein